MKEVALLNYVQWRGRTGKPPPLTVYAEPGLQQVLRGLRQKQRQPLPPPEDEVQVVADLIHVPDDARNDSPQDSSVKLKPKPKTKHGSADAAPPEPSQPSRPLQPTAISSDTSMEELPCKIMAGDLTLTSHDYGKIPTHARRRPKKRPKPHKDTSKTVSTEAAPPPTLKEATVLKTSPTLPSSEGVFTHVSADTASGRHQSPSLAAASSSLAPTATENSQPPDTALPGNQKIHAASPAPAVDTAGPVSEHAAKAKKTKDPDCDPKTKSKHRRATGAKTPKGTKLSRQATSTRSSKAPSSTSRKRAASSTEIMDPDFRPDPAKRPKIVSPWLEPMSKAAQRYMTSSSFHSMHSLLSLQQPVLTSQYCSIWHAVPTFLIPRLTSRNVFQIFSAKTPNLSLWDLVPATGSLPHPHCQTQVRAPQGDSFSVTTRHVPRSLCLGKHLRIARFRQSLPRRRRRPRIGHVHYWSGPWPAWLLPVSKTLLSAFSFWRSLCVTEFETVQMPSPALPAPTRDLSNRSHQCPSTRCTAVPGPKSGSNPPAGYKPKASSYLLLLYLSIFRGASVRITEPRVGGSVDRHPPEAIHWHSLHATAAAKPFGLSLNEAPNLKAIRKRSLFRALRRLDRTGNTTYRGHRFTLPLANAPPQYEAAGPGRASTSCRGMQAGYPVTAISSYYYGFRVRASTSMSLPYRRLTGATMPVIKCKAGTHIISPCSANDKSAGILILVNQRLYPPHKVQLTCLVDGRLIHLRLELNPSIDVLVLYQHLHATSAQHKGQEGLNHAQIQRSKVWTKVHQSLSGFPSRNSVLLLGDCNTDLFPDLPHVGPGVRTRLSKQPPDQHEFQQLLKTFSLCALNCWRRAGTQAQTFLPATGLRGTQIDFVLTRLSQADGPARTCAPTWLPFVEDSGMRHLPLLGSIPMPSLPKRTQTTSPKLSLASVRQTLRTHPDLALAYATKATQLLKDSSPNMISSKLQEAWLQCDPSSSAPSAGPGTHTQAIMHLWELRRARRLFLSSRPPNDTDPWPLESDLRSKTKALKQACKQSQQDRIHRILTEAEQAAHKGLTAVYQVVRKLAPKSARKPILFRDPAGAPLSTEQEVKSLKDYFRNLYRSDYPEAVPPGHSFPSFTKEETARRPATATARQSTPFLGRTPHRCGLLQRPLSLKSCILLCRPGATTCTRTCQATGQPLHSVCLISPLSRPRHQRTSDRLPFYIRSPNVLPPWPPSAYDPLSLIWRVDFLNLHMSACAPLRMPLSVPAPIVLQRGLSWKDKSTTFTGDEKVTQWVTAKEASHSLLTYLALLTVCLGKFCMHHCSLRSWTPNS